MKLIFKFTDVVTHQCDRCIFLIESTHDKWGHTDFECINADHQDTYFMVKDDKMKDSSCKFFSPLTEWIKL